MRQIEESRLESRGKRKFQIGAVIGRGAYRAHVCNASRPFFVQSNWSQVIFIHAYL